MRHIILLAIFTLPVVALHGQYANEHIIAPLERIGDVLTGDVDGDSITDMVSCGVEGPISLYRGAGDGTFLPREIIGNHGTTALNQNGLVDVDGDQDLDIIYHDLFGAVKLLRNDGSGNFSPAEVLFQLPYSMPFTGNDGMQFRDLDGDGDVDIVFSRELYPNDQIVWYANNGSGAFTFMGIVGYGAWVLAVDMDGDGDADLLASAGVDHHFLRYNNNGSGVFAAAVVIPSGSTYSPENVCAADLNMDGLADICFTDFTHKIRLLLSNADGTFTPSVIYTGVEDHFLAGLRLADMDTSGTADVVFLDDRALLGYLPNPGDGIFPATPDTLIPLPTAITVDPFIAVDMDNNGVPDIVMKTIGELAYLPNMDGGITPPLRIVSRAMDERSLLMGDLDQDGDQDAISISSGINDLGLGSEILAAMNDGNGVFSPPHIIANPALGLGSDATRYQLHDMDGDGNPDIILLDIHTYQWNLSWLVNNGNGYFDSLVVVLNNASDYKLADLDQDGQEDIIAVTSSQVVWAHGLGGGLFGPFISLGGPSGMENLAVGDLDNDGDTDILVTYNSVGVLENQGAGVFGPYSTLSGSSTYASPLTQPQIADLDGDGLPDAILSTCWLKNLGGLQFSGAQCLSNVGGAYGSQPVDLDGDGDLDILYANINSYSIYWAQNLGAGVFAPGTELATVHGVPFYANSVDVDSDGILDLAYSLIPDSSSGPYSYCPGWIGGMGISTAIHDRPVASVSASVYPDPFSQEATIQLAQPLLQGERLVLLDELGRTVRTMQGTGNDHLTLERGNLSDGHYVLMKQAALGAALVGRVVID